MKRIAWVVFGWLSLTAWPAMATDNGTVTVTVSPEVQEQLRNASPEERNKLESAIIVGNKFIPYHFNGSAYEADDNKEKNYWLNHIHPLVNRDLSKWYEMWDVSSPSEPAFMEGQKLSNLSVCPQIELISITKYVKPYEVGWKTYSYSPPLSFADDSFILIYRAKIVGALNYTHAPPKFFPAASDDFERVLISLDKNSKVNKVISEYSGWIIQRDIAYLAKTKSSAAGKDALKNLLRKLKAEAAATCNGADGR